MLLLRNLGGIFTIIIIAINDLTVARFLGLALNTVYYFQASAYNSLGMGPVSDVSGLRTAEGLAILIMLTCVF